MKCIISDLEITKKKKRRPMRIVCNKCKKTVAKGWVCCPYCGQIRVCKKETKILLVIPDEHQVLEGDIVSFKIIKREEGEPK